MLKYVNILTKRVYEKNRGKRPEFNECSHLLRILNDDCLLHVLGHLDFMDIKTLSKCCHRLNRIVNSEMIHRFHIIPVSVARHGWLTVSKHAPVIRHLIVDLEICSRQAIHELMKLLRHCSHLEKLELCGIAHHQLFSSIKLDKIFSKLKELELNFEIWNGIWSRQQIEAVMVNCHQLEVLRIGGEIPNVCLEIHYPRLREIEISSEYFTISNECMSNFYANNSHITKLTFMITTDTLPVLDFSGLTVMQNLEELYILTDAKKIIHPNFNKMPALKHVWLMYYKNKELPDMSSLNHVDLDELCIACHIREETAQPLNAIPKQTTVFEMYNDRHETISLLDIIDFVKQRPKLQQLEIPSFYKFLQYNSHNFVVIHPEVMDRLVSERATRSGVNNFNFINHDKLQLRSLNLYFTHSDEISDLKQIVLRRLSSSSREILRTIKCDDLTDRHFREAKLSPAYYSDGSESNPILLAGKSETQKQRIVFLLCGLTCYLIRL